MKPVNRNIVLLSRIFAKIESASRIAIHTFKSDLEIVLGKINETKIVYSFFLKGKSDIHNFVSFWVGYPVPGRIR